MVGKVVGKVVGKDAWPSMVLTAAVLALTAEGSAPSGYLRANVYASPVALLATHLQP